MKFKQQFLVFFLTFMSFHIAAQEKMIQIKVVDAVLENAKETPIFSFRDNKLDLSLTFTANNGKDTKVFSTRVIGQDDFLGKTFNLNVSDLKFEDYYSLKVELFENDPLLDKITGKDLISAKFISFGYKKNLYNPLSKPSLELTSDDGNIKIKIVVDFDNDNYLLNKKRNQCSNIDLLKQKGVSIPVSNQVKNRRDTNTCYSHSASDLIDFEKSGLKNIENISEHYLANVERFAGGGGSTRCLEGGQCFKAINGFNKIGGLVCTGVPIEKLAMTFGYLNDAGDRRLYRSVLKDTCSGVVNYDSLIWELERAASQDKKLDLDRINNAGNFSLKQINFLKDIINHSSLEIDELMLTRDSLVRIGCRDVYKDDGFMQYYQTLIGKTERSSHILVNTSLSKEDYLKLRRQKPGSIASYLANVCPNATVLGKVRSPRVERFMTRSGPYNSLKKNDFQDSAPSDFVDSLLSRENPSLVSLSICTNALNTGSLSGGCKISHAITLVGRRFNETTKKCEYKLKESSGSSFGENGYRWLSEEWLDLGTLDVQYLD